MKIYLNLLPEERKNRIARAKRFKFLVKQEILFAFPLLVFVVMLINISYLLKLQLGAVIKDSTKQNEQGDYRELDEYEKSIKEFNTNISAIKDMTNKNLQWTNFLSKLAILIPEGVSLKDITTKNYQVFMVGSAKNREAMIKFKDSLEKEGCFESVNIPLSNLVAKENIDFQIDVTLKQECLMASEK